MITIILILIPAYFIYGGNRTIDETESHLQDSTMRRWGSRPSIIIRKLGNSSYNKKKQAGQNTCAICIDQFTDKCQITVLPCDVRHYFHTKCIQQWLERETNCPLCKAPIDI